MSLFGQSPLTFRRLKATHLGHEADDPYLVLGVPHDATDETVRANEPGNLAYQLTKSRTDPQTYRVLELYRDQDALTHHGGTDYFKAAGPKFMGVLAGRPEIEYLDGVG